MENKDQKEQFSSSPLERVRQASRVNAGEDDEISLKELVLKLRDYYYYLLSKWAIILIAGIVGSISGLTYSLFNKPVYTATTTFVLESGDGNTASMGQYAGLASMVGIDIAGGGGIFQGDNIIELYRSRTMIEKALLSEVDINGKKRLLIDWYIEFSNLRTRWVNNPELISLQFSSQAESTSRLQDSILGETVKQINKKHLTVSKPDKKLSIIRVDVKANDELFAKSFNDQIVKNVNDFYVQTKTKKSLQNVAILQQKTDSVRAVMNGAIYSTAEVADATPNLNPTRQIQRAAPMQRSQFTAETSKSILGELVKNLEMSKISLHKETPLIQVVDHPVFPLEIERFEKVHGLVLGFIFGTFLTSIFLIVNLFYKTVIK